MARKEAGFLREDDGREILSGKPAVGEQGGISVDEDGARAVSLKNFSGVGGGASLSDGSVTTPKIADGAVTAVKVAADVATQAELDANALADRDRANHTGTQTASTISNFDTQVRTSRLDQMATPTADVAMGARKLTGLASGTLATDAATLSQVQAGASGIDPKESVRALATTNLTLSGTQTVDTVALVAGNRVLVAGQTTASQNGIYVVAAGAWSRATDADTSAEVTAGMHTFVEEGTHAGEGWVLSTSGTITLGTTALLFVKFSASGSIVAGAGLTGTGSTVDVSTDNSTLEVVGDQVRVKDGGITAAKVAADVATQAELDANATADRARANHTGTQVSATISDFTEAVQDIIGTSLAAGTGATVSYDDPSGTTTISATGGTGTVSDASTTVKGVVKLASAPATATDPIAVGTNDRRMTRSVVPPWTGSTLVDIYERRTAPDGREIQSTAARTTRASFDATEQTFWVQIGVDTTDLEAGLAGKMDNPTGTKTTGYVPVVQSGGTTAWAAPPGGSVTAAAVSYAGSTALPTNPATVEAAIDTLADNAATTATSVAGIQATGMTSATVKRVEGITAASLAALEAANQDESGVLYIITAPPYVIFDDFSRAVTGGLGSAPTGGTWTINPSGSATDWSVVNATDGYAQTNHPTMSPVGTGTDRYSYIPVSGMNQVVESTFSLTSLPTASSFFWSAMMRFISTNQNYKVRCEITATTVKLTVQKVVGGTSYDIGAQSSSVLTYTADTKLSMKAEIIDLGTTAQVRAKLWLTSGSEPGSWTIDRTDDGVTYGGAINPAGGAGFYTRAGTNATPTPNTFRTYQFQVT